MRPPKSLSPNGLQLDFWSFIAYIIYRKFEVGAVPTL